MPWRWYARSCGHTRRVAANKGFGLVAQVVSLVLLILGVGSQRAVFVNGVVLVDGQLAAAERVPFVPTRRHVLGVVSIQVLAGVKGVVAGFVQPGGYRRALQVQLTELLVAA